MKGDRFRSVRRVAIQVQRVIAVRGKEDIVADPDRLVIGRRMIRQLFRRVVFEIVDPHVLGATAAITFPGPELSVDGRVHDLPAVRREHAAAALRDFHGQLVAAVCRNQVVAAHAHAPGQAVRPHQNVLAIPRPIEDAVVRAAARRHGTDVVVPGQLARCAAGRRDDVDLSRAVVLCRIGDPGAIRRKFGKLFQAVMRGQPDSRPAIRRCDIQIAGVNEYDSVVVNIGKPQQPCFAGDSDFRDRQNQDEQDGSGCWHVCSPRQIQASILPPKKARKFHSSQGCSVSGARASFGPDHLHCHKRKRAFAGPFLISSRGLWMRAHRFDGHSRAAGWPQPLPKPVVPNALRAPRGPG